MTPSTRLKMTVFAPIPSASVAMAIALKPGFFRSIRPATLKSVTSVSSIAARFYQTQYDATALFGSRPSGEFAFTLLAETPARCPRPE